MKKKMLYFMTVLSILMVQNAFGQANNSLGTLPPFTKWYQNPLGISPIALHTGNGIIVPTLVAGTILIFTKKDASLHHRLSFYDDIGYTKGYYGSYSKLYHNNLGINYMLRKYMSVGVEFTQSYITDDINNTFGIGLRPFFRFYPINKEKFNLFFSSGAGIMYFLDRFPKPSGFFGDMREGTKLNGCPKYGVGTEVKISPNLNISAGLWHIHFSNGDNPNYERNPGHDSNGFSVGLVYKPHHKSSSIGMIQKNVF